MHQVETKDSNQGVFCMTCGRPCQPSGHTDCVPNPEFVKKIVELNKLASEAAIDIGENNV